MIHLIESFDAYHQTNGQPINTGGPFAAKWVLDSGISETTQEGRDTGKACGLTGIGRISTPTFSPAIVTPLIGFAVKVVSVGSQSQLLLPRFNSNVSRAQLRLNTDRTLSVYRGSTLLATTVQDLWLGTWYYIEFKTKMTASAGSYELRIDGITALANPSVSMDDTGTSGTNNISFGAGTGVDVHIDDVFVLDCDAGTVNVDCLGPCKAINQVPTGVESNTGWTANTGIPWEAVREYPPDGDTTYVESSTPGATILFTK